MKEQQETRYSLDSGCDSTSEKVKITIKEEEPLMFLTTKNDNESVYSANSAATTITTSSTYRKKPSTMFSSVKQFISSSKKSIYPEQEPSRLKRHTPSTISFGSLFSRNKQQLENEASTGSSLFSLSPPNQPATFGYSSSSDDTNRASAWHRSKRRNSVVDLASRFLSNKKDDYKLDSQEEEEEEEDDEEESIFKFETHAGHSQLEIQVHQEEDSVGTLLFGKDVDHLEFLQHEATKSESLLSTKHEHLQQRQRAKSCLVKITTFWRIAKKKKKKKKRGGRKINFFSFFLLFSRRKAVKHPCYITWQAMIIR
jgi:hypothetical protein